MVDRSPPQLVTIRREALALILSAVRSGEPVYEGHCSQCDRLLAEVQSALKGATICDLCGLKGFHENAPVRP